MRKSILLIMATFWVCFAFAQPTFENYYELSGTYQYNLIELPSHNLNVGGFVLTDPTGDILNAHYITGDTILALHSIVQSGENEFQFVTGYYKDTCSLDNSITHIYPVIGNMDSLGNVQSLHYYRLTSDACSNLLADLEVTSNKDVIAWGRHAMFFALRVDSAGTPLWAKRFDHFGSFQFIRELPGGDLLAGINMDTAGAVIARMDATGNFLWLKSYIRPYGRVNDVVIESDSSFVIIGYTDNTVLQTTVDQKLFMLKLDGSGEVQWCKGYESANKWRPDTRARINRALDGNYVVLANLRGQNGARPFLMKTNLNGDTIWTRSAGVGNYSYETSNLLAYSDGSFMQIGRAFGNFWPNSSATYIFKTDSMGHLPCSEAWYPVQVMNLFPSDSSFTLTSTDGATEYPAFAQDTIYNDPITVYDGCTITQIPNYALKRPPPGIRPNPTTGRFTMDFVDPLRADSFYSVYDSMGKLLYQRPLPSGATTEEVDLARFGKGMYLVKITDPEGVRTERVVVE